MIPTTLDCVNVGGFERIGESQIKCIIILGAIDGRIPMHDGRRGILSDSERERLEEEGISLANGAKERLDDEFRLLYKALTISSDKVILSVPKVAPDGQEAQPSFIVSRIMSALKGCQMMRFADTDTYAIKPCFDLAASCADSESLAAARAYFADNAEYSEKLAIASKNAKLTRSPLRDRDNINALFGKTIRLSASRIESFNSCRYQYFLKYGLRLKPARRAKFDALEIGTFIHEILENTLREIKLRGGHRVVDRETVTEIADVAILRYIHEKLGGLMGKTARTMAQFRRLKETVHQVILNIHEELSNSLFAPIDFELNFSDNGGNLPALTLNGEDFTVKLEGFVDRVDACELDDTLYIRVVDYKTGKKTFNLDEVLNGLNMQLLLYMFTICDLGATRYGRKPCAAGVLYNFASDTVYRAKGGESADAILSARTAAKKRSGLLLNRKDLCKNDAFLPVKLKKDGEFDAKSSVASDDEFARISKRMNEILLNIGRELSGGEIEANPYYKNATETACDFCDMRAACHFDERAGEKKRYLFTTKMEDC